MQALKSPRQMLNGMSQHWDIVWGSITKDKEEAFQRQQQPMVGLSVRGLKKITPVEGRGQSARHERSFLCHVAWVVGIPLGAELAKAGVPSERTAADSKVTNQPTASDHHIPSHARHAWSGVSSSLREMDERVSVSVSWQQRECPSPFPRLP